MLINVIFLDHECGSRVTIEKCVYVIDWQVRKCQNFPHKEPSWFHRLIRMKWVFSALVTNK